MRSLIKKIVHPLLSRWYERKTKKVQQYQRHGIVLDIYPGVFHPGIFLSTNLFIDFLSTKELKDKRVLELGAGSGMISFYCAQKGAIVTATDINSNAIKGLKANAKQNQLSISVVNSDLFEAVDPNAFDLLLINPPYYPQEPKDEKDMAFYCGSSFQYFERLFSQLSQSILQQTIWMILSEDCDLERIRSIAGENGLSLELVFETKKRMERNFIFKIASNG